MAFAQAFDFQTIWRARRDFELLTPKFVVWCSIQLSYGRGAS